jgi:hypothetical protein
MLFFKFQMFFRFLISLEAGTWQFIIPGLLCANFYEKRRQNARYLVAG